MTNHSKPSCEKKTKNANRSEQNTFKAQWIFPKTLRAHSRACCFCRKKWKYCVPLCLATGQKSVWSASEGSTHAVRTHHIFPSFHVTFLNKSEPSAARERSVAWQGEGQNWTNQNQLCIHLIFPRFAHIVRLLRYLIGLLKICVRRDWPDECCFVGS